MWQFCDCGDCKFHTWPKWKKTDFIKVSKPDIGYTYTNYLHEVTQVTKNTMHLFCKIGLQEMCCATLRPKVQSFYYTSIDTYSEENHTNKMKKTNYQSWAGVELSNPIMKFTSSCNQTLSQKCTQSFFSSLTVKLSKMPENFT